MKKMNQKVVRNFHEKNVACSDGDFIKATILLKYSSYYLEFYRAKYENCRHLLALVSHNFDKNFVNATYLLKKEITK